MKRVVIIEDQRAICDMLAELVHVTGGFEVIGTYLDGESGVEAILELKPDVVILDPPRAGLHQNVIDVLRQVNPQKIVYVSCNPATQARDLGLLSDLYEITHVQAIDMFPHTHHVENIVRIENRKPKIDN